MIVAAYQGFVDVNYQKIHWRQWLKPSFWKQINQTIADNEPAFMACDTPLETHSASDNLYADAKRLQVTCSAASCVFEMKPTATVPVEVNTSSAQVQVILHQSLPAGQTTPDVKILWADLTKGSIIYQVAQLKTAYVISFDSEVFAENLAEAGMAQPTPAAQVVEPKLLHDISLEPGLNQVLTLLAIKRATNGQDYLVAVSSSRKELYLYGLDRKWLQYWPLPDDVEFAVDQGNDLRGCLVTTTGELYSIPHRP